MKRGMKADMRKFLEPTALVDSRHPLITRLAARFAAAAGSARELAKAIFNFVREQVTYELRPSNLPASRVLAERAGQCFNKAILQVAIARAAALPAGFVPSLIRREVYRPIVTANFYEKISPETWHCAGAFLLDGRWVEADATLDRATLVLYAGHLHAFKPNPWDGARPFALPERVVVEKLPVRASIDDVARLQPRGVTRREMTAQNRRIRRLKRAFEEKEDVRGR